MTDPAERIDAASLGLAIRRRILDQSSRAGVGHIGSALSIADVLAVLFSGTLALDGPDRDRFVLSKGHAALALYAALDATGRLSAGMLDTYCGDGSLLGVHPERELDGVDFCTGSLGQGLGMAAGAALGARLAGSPRRCVALVSDGELNEGALWEAVMFAGHHGLSALTVVVDLNGQQAFGYTADVLDLGDVAARFASFGWEAAEVDGHDHGELHEALSRRAGDRPRAIVARTTFGYGVSFMRNVIDWHYLPMTAEQYAQALQEVTG